MADNRSSRKKGGGQKAGRNKRSVERYYSLGGYGGGRIARKLRRIIRSSGFEEAERWAKSHGTTDTLNCLLTRKSDGSRGMVKWIHDKMHDALQRRVRKEQVP